MWPTFFAFSAKCAAFYAMTDCVGSTTGPFTLLVIHIPARLAVRSMFLHVTAMAQNFDVLKPLILLVPIPMMNPKTRLRTIMAAPFTMPNPLDKPSRRSRRQPVIAGNRILAEKQLAVPRPTFRRPASFHQGNRRTLVFPAAFLRDALLTRRHRSPPFRRPNIRRLALATLLSGRIHRPSASRANLLSFRHVVILCVKEIVGYVGVILA